MRKPRWWRKSLVVLAIAVAAFTALPTAHAQQVFLPGTVVALEGTPHLWIADAQGVLHWGGDTRALAGRHINWNARVEVSLEGLRALPKGDPWLSAGLLKQGDPIYLVKWETDWPVPRLLHIQSIADVEIFGINETNYGNFVLDVPTWESRYGMSVASLQRAALPAAVGGAGMTPTAPSTPAPVTARDIPFQRISGFDGGGGTLDLPQGDITLKLQFGGWGAGPVTVTYRIDGGAPIHLFNNAQANYYTEIVLNVPRAATYTFGVTAVRDWKIWVGLEPGLPSVPLPIEGCRTVIRWHKADDGTHRSRYDCGGVELNGTSYAEINTDERQWAVWHRSGQFIGVTFSGSAVVTGNVSVPYQEFKGFNGGAGQLTLTQGQVSVMLEYGNWGNAPLTLTYRTPSGAQVRVIDNAMIGYRTSWTINVTEAGLHTLEIAAQGSWRVWVGTDLGSASDILESVGSPVDGCTTTQPWKRIDGVHRVRFKCPEFILYGAHYPGFTTEKGIWVVWLAESDFHSATFHGK